MQQRLDDVSLRLERSMRAHVRLAHEAVNRFGSALVHLSPRTQVGLSRARLAAVENRLMTALRSRLRQDGKRLERLTASLQALSPLAVLSRGYSICRSRSTGVIVRDASAVAPGMPVDITLWRGSLQCTVDAVAAKGPGNGTADI
jgi:exodeoxyribonuclease VII large subunit